MGEDAGAGQGALSLEEQKLYDRQLRVWGAEAQGRLKRADVLVLGAVGARAARGTAGEVMKNLALSGVGALTVGVCGRGDGGGDDGGVSLLDGMYRWAPAEGPGAPAATEAEAEAHRVVVALKDMNPLVNVRVVRLSGAGAGERTDRAEEEGSADGGAAPAGHDGGFLKRFQCVLIFRQQFSFAYVRRVARAARDADVGCYVAEVRGEHGYFASDLGVHAYKEDQGDQKGSAHVQAYPPLEDVIAMPRSSLPRRAPQMAAALRVAAAVDDEGLGGHGTPEAAAKAVRSRLVRDEGFRENCVSDGVLEEFITSSRGDPSVDAIVGGVLAQDMVRALTRAGRPIHNFFCFSTCDGGGWALPIAAVAPALGAGAAAAEEPVAVL